MIYVLNFASGVAGVKINWNLVKERVDQLWEEFGVPIWITEFDWNHQGDIEWGDQSKHAEIVDDFYKLMFSHEVIAVDIHRFYLKI